MRGRDRGGLWLWGIGLGCGCGDKGLGWAAEVGDRVGVSCQRPWIGEEWGRDDAYVRFVRVGGMLCVFCACRGMLCVFCTCRGDAMCVLCV